MHLWRGQWQTFTLQYLCLLVKMGDCSIRVVSDCNWVCDRAYSCDVTNAAFIWATCRIYLNHVDRTIDNWFCSFLPNLVWQQPIRYYVTITSSRWVITGAHEPLKAAKEHATECHHNPNYIITFGCYHMYLVQITRLWFPYMETSWL